MCLFVPISDLCVCFFFGAWVVVVVVVVVGCRKHKEDQM